jgi:Ca2+-binding RTX toxin-like protein
MQLPDRMIAMEHLMADILGTNAPETLNGTSQADRIYGLDGDDKLYGGTGNDEIYGGFGNDTLRGDAGADLMFGGAGNDTYYVDDAGDIVSEQLVPGVDDGGNDRVYTTITFSLGAFIERATLTGTAAGDLTGNDVANVLTGNDAANILSGGGGIDDLLAGGGNDRLIGGAGKDNLTGGLGADTFVFGPADVTSTDKVKDFSAEDFLGISANDFGLTLGNGLVDNGSGTLVLDPDYFTIISGSSNVQGTISGHGQFLFNTTTLTLLWDADGASTLSSGVAIATFNAGTTLSATSFLVTPPTESVGNISISDVTISEGNSGTQSVTFTVSRTGTLAFSIDFATADGSATAGSDYSPAFGTLTFAAGQMTQTVTVTINGDMDFELNETFFLNLANASNGGVIVDGQGLSTINNDDAPPPVVGDISIDNVSIVEGNAGTQTVVFTISRTGTAAFSVDYASANGSATAGSDYSATSGTVSFATGQTTQTVSVTINGDVDFESNETFFINLANATNGGVIVDGQGLGTITNDETIGNPDQVTINDVVILEGDSGVKTATFTVTRTGTSAFSVDFATTNGTAFAGKDYLAAAGTLNFAAGQLLQTVSITIIGDTNFDRNETFFLNLNNASNGALILDNQGLGLITNGDAYRIVPDNIGTSSSEDVSGNALTNRIYGLSGNDRLYAKAGNDVLFGGAGNDKLDGGAGFDNMFGGSGDDTYRVDELGDIVSEESVAQGIDDGGSDTVESSTSFTLGAFVEKLTLTGTNASNGVGNGLANIIKGNETSNVLSGMIGDDDLRGNGGDDTLVGGAGFDTLTGGAGADVFVLGGADVTSTDRIVDFSSSVDRIRVFSTNYGLAEGQGLISGLLDPTYFVQVSGTQNQGTVAGHGQFLYNLTTSTLMWDADGSGTGATGVAIATFNPVNSVPVVLTANSILVATGLPSVSVINPSLVAGNEGDQAYFVFSLAAVASEDVYIRYSTTGTTATSGSDFVGSVDNFIVIRAGTISATVNVSLLLDSVVETLPETYTVQILSATLPNGTNLPLGTHIAGGLIAENPNHVVNIIDTRSLGTVDPSGLAYVPGVGLFVSDSEVEETPFGRTNNLFRLQTDGTLPAQFSILNFSNEPTGLAYDSIRNRLYITDDDQFKVFWVDPANPTVKGGEFSVPASVDDPEDIAFNPNTGGFFISNGYSRSIVELDASGAQVGSPVILPSFILDPEALVYDAQHDVFYVSGGFTHLIWRVDRNGNVLETIDVLAGYTNPVSGTSGVNVKDMEFAPTSDPNDDPSLMSLYVADYGNTHLSPVLSDDGRIFEVFINGAPTDPGFMV